MQKYTTFLTWAFDIELRSLKRSKDCPIHCVLLDTVTRVHYFPKYFFLKAFLERKPKIFGKNSITQVTWCKWQRQHFQVIFCISKHLYRLIIGEQKESEEIYYCYTFSILCVNFSLQSWTMDSWIHCKAITKIAFDLFQICCLLWNMCFCA